MFERLKEKMDLTFYSEEIRQEFKNDLRGELSLEDRAYKYLFVNRSSFNGVGGSSTTMIVRRNMSKSCSDYLSMIDKLPEIHNRLSSVIIEHKDIMALLDKYDNEKTFMYLDPPYVRETRLSNQTYEVEMTDEEHIALCERLLTFKGKERGLPPLPNEEFTTQKLKGLDEKEWENKFTLSRLRNEWKTKVEIDFENRKV